MDLLHRGRLIYQVIAGSHAYGTATETSDVDKRGCFMPPPGYLLGFNQHDKKETHRNDATDEEYHSLGKFVRLASNSHPNVLETMFMDETTLLVDDLFRPILDIRQEFLSKNIARTFAGYAHGQLELMTKRGGKGNHGVRQKLIEEHGYDSKHGSRLIHLLFSASDALKTGEFRVKPNQDRLNYLREIRAGLVPLERVLKDSELLFEEVRRLKEVSPLPDEPNIELITKTVVDVHYNYLRSCFD